MNTRFTLAAVVAIIALVAIVACGGGSDDSGDAGAIRIQKGLAVAAAGGNLSGGSGGDEINGGTGAEPAPAIDQPGAPLRTGYTETSSNFAGKDIAYGGYGGFAPEPYPYQQAGTNGITVQGYASASADADSAIVEFYFNNYGSGVKPLPYPEVEPGFPSDGSPLPQDIEPITEAFLKPVVDAIAGAGVSSDDIEFLNVYADPYSSSATLRATVKNIDSVDTVVEAATQAAAALSSATLSNTNVSYTLSDCAALEVAATKAAVEDAGERAATFAQALGVAVGSVVGASNFSYFGGTPCDSGYFKGPYPVGGISYFEGQPREVQVYANIAITYAIQ